MMTSMMLMVGREGGVDDVAVLVDDAVGGQGGVGGGVLEGQGVGEGRLDGAGEGDVVGVGPLGEGAGGTALAGRGGGGAAAAAAVVAAAAAAAADHGRDGPATLDEGSRRRAGPGLGR
ncbi:hypothetical protein VTK73DRAFT_4640 [Phialemonium thermophilum]|uniref:Uncharacterized protein n=1 Tax=Phialemonium thermophilum TaxID=223376 RepID=A0ABR3V760_9PEZI